jgi:glycosyltransferase involved in cell wall biosynthesis
MRTTTQNTPRVIAFFLGTHEDWGGASRALLNFIRSVDRHRFTPLVIVTREGQLTHDLSHEGIKWALWQGHERSKNLLAYARHILEAYNTFRSWKIDLAHVNHGALGWKPAELLALKLARIPIITHVHITLNNPSSYLKLSDTVIAVSDFIARESQLGNIPTIPIHNVSYLDRFARGKDLREELGYSRDETLIFYAGQMIREKGIDLLVDAFSRIPHPEARLVLAGPMRKTASAYSAREVQDLVSRDSRIRYIGFRTDAENVYATADIMVMPSRWDEPCAMVLFEAAAAGKPVIASRTGGTPEIVHDGETGYMFERDDAAELARLMTKLIEDPNLRVALGAASRRLAEMEFSNGPVRKLEQLYERILAN